MSSRWRLGIALTLLAVLGGVNWAQERAAYSALSSNPTAVAIVQASDWPIPDSEVEALVRQAVALAGGLQEIIAPGDTVVVKPNMVWNASPETGIVTDPRVVRAVVRLAQEAGAGTVIIAEGTACYANYSPDARGATVAAFRDAGYDANRDMRDDATGALLVDLNDTGGLDQYDPTKVVQVQVPNGLIWTSYWLPRVIMEADVLIGVPVLKNHFTAGVTLGLKNQIGIAPSDIYHSPGSQMLKGALYHGPNDLGRHIVDLNLARPLDFVVVDGLRGMMDGPVGGNLAYPRMRLIIAGKDAVAVDTVGSLVMGYDPASIPYLSWAAGAGLGTDDVSQITVRGRRVSQVRRDFPAPYGNPPAGRAEAVPPTVQITAPQNGMVVAEWTTVWASATDDQGVAKVEFYAGDQLLATVRTPPYYAVLDLSSFRGQTVTLQAIAYDRALNDAVARTTVAVVQAPPPGTASFQTATLTIPTYPYHDCLREGWDGPYRYRWLDRSCYGNPTPVPRNYTALVMENDYLRVTVLPELGGRVYQLVYKATGNNQLYQNPVIKPTGWGPLGRDRNWWLAAGGIEWGLPVVEHGYEWGEPWAWSAVTSTAGVTVTVRDTTATNRLRAAMDLALPADRGYLAITPRLENPTPSAIAYSFWLNAMLAPGPQNRPTADLQFIFNAAQMAVHSTGDCRLPGCWPTEPSGPDYRFTWPLYNGVDYSRLGNWTRWLGFFEYPQAAADFMGVYSPAAGEGVARVFPSGIARGAKGFAMGWSDPLDWHEWTDDGSGYVELHGGVAPTFWESATLTAATTLAWTEYWYPVGAIGTLSAATPDAALGLTQEGGMLRVGVHSTQARAAGESLLYVWDRATCAPLGFRRMPALDPAYPQVTLVPSGGRSPEQVAVAYLDSVGNLLAAVNPTDCLLPRAWVNPLPPRVLTTTFTVTWAGEDVWTGVAAYDVQVRDGYEGTWTDWLTGTVATSAPFNGAHGHTYFFRARARDQAGNWGAYTDEEWGQAFTTVLTEPAPVLVTSRKTAAPALFAPDQQVFCTVLIRNTGNLTATVALTDTPPVEMVVLTDTLSATAGLPPFYADGAIRWAGEVPADSAVWVTYVLSPTADTPLMVPMTNTAEISGSVLGPIVRRYAVTQARLIWLPLVGRGWIP